MLLHDNLLHLISPCSLLWSVLCLLADLRCLLQQQVLALKLVVLRSQLPELSCSFCELVLCLL